MNCPYCEGRGKVKSALSMSVEIQRRIGEVMRRQKATANTPLPVKITVNPAVLDRLRSEDEELLVNLEKKHHGHLTFVANPGMHVEEYSIARAESGEMLYQSGSARSGE
jgi:ribonuclease G